MVGPIASRKAADCQNGLRVEVRRLMPWQRDRPGSGGVPASESDPSTIATVQAQWDPIGITIWKCAQERLSRAGRVEVCTGVPDQVLEAPLVLSEAYRVWASRSARLRERDRLHLGDDLFNFFI